MPIAVESPKDRSKADRSRSRSFCGGKTQVIGTAAWSGHYPARKDQERCSVSVPPEMSAIRTSGSQAPTSTLRAQRFRNLQHYPGKRRSDHRHHLRRLREIGRITFEQHGWGTAVQDLTRVDGENTYYDFSNTSHEPRRFPRCSAMAGKCVVAQPRWLQGTGKISNCEVILRKYPPLFSAEK
jgi:hypothetical protein